MVLVPRWWWRWWLACRLWGKAQELYIAAQVKARSGSLPYAEGEYLLWEEHWIMCAKRLQQWDMLIDFARQQTDRQLLLEWSVAVRSVAGAWWDGCGGRTH